MTIDDNLRLPPPPRIEQGVSQADIDAYGRACAGAGIRHALSDSYLRQTLLYRADLVRDVVREIDAREDARLLAEALKRLPESERREFLAGIFPPLTLVERIVESLAPNEDE